MEIRSPYSACTALLERLPRFSAAARSMAAMGGARPVFSQRNMSSYSKPFSRAERTPVMRLHTGFSNILLRRLR